MATDRSTLAASFVTCALKVYRLITFEKQFWVFLKPCSFCQFFQRLAGWPAWE
jgi:hypothetical protein